MITRNNRLPIILCIAGAILLVPLVAMQFTSEVNWSIGDFVIMGGLLVSAGLACEFAIRKANSSTNRIIFCAVILVMLLLVWAELAVGIFGTPFAGS